MIVENGFSFYYYTIRGYFFTRFDLNVIAHLKLYHRFIFGRAIFLNPVSIARQKLRQFL